MRSTDNELACRVDVVGDAVVEEATDALGANAVKHTGNEYLFDVAGDALLHGFVRVELVVLSRYHDGVNALRYTFVAVFYRDLALGIRAQVGHHLAFATDVGKRQEETMREVEGERHVVLGLVGCIAEHHALVSCTLCGAVCTVNTTVDVCALLVDGREHTATVALEHILALGIADAVDDFASDTLQVNVSLCLDFACQHDLSGRDECFARHLRIGIEGKQFVEHGIADLIGHLVGMAFGD